MDTGELRQQHAEIGTIAAQLRQAIADPGRPQSVSALRWQLARKLMAHLALEDRILYPAMQRSTDETIRTTAARIQSEIGTLADRFTRYMADWSDERIALQWRAFCLETGQILDALARRIDREDNLLYPIAATASDEIKSVRTA